MPIRSTACTMRLAGYFHPLLKSPDTMETCARFRIHALDLCFEEISGASYLARSLRQISETTTLRQSQFHTLLEQRADPLTLFPNT